MTIEIAGLMITCKTKDYRNQKINCNMGNIETSELVIILVTIQNK